MDTNCKTPTFTITNSDDLNNLSSEAISNRFNTLSKQINTEYTNRISTKKFMVDPYENAKLINKIAALTNTLTTKINNEAKTTSQIVIEPYLRLIFELINSENIDNNKLEKINNTINDVSTLLTETVQTGTLPEPGTLIVEPPIEGATELDPKAPLPELESNAPPVPGTLIVAPPIEEELEPELDPKAPEPVPGTLIVAPPIEEEPELDPKAPELEPELKTPVPGTPEPIEINLDQTEDERIIEFLNPNTLPASIKLPRRQGETLTLQDKTSPMPTEPATPATPEPGTPDKPPTSPTPPTPETGAPTPETGAPTPETPETEVKEPVPPTYGTFGIPKGVVPQNILDMPKTENQVVPADFQAQTDINKKLYKEAEMRDAEVKKEHEDKLVKKHGKNVFDKFGENVIAKKNEREETKGPEPGSVRSMVAKIDAQNDAQNDPRPPSTGTPIAPIANGTKNVNAAKRARSANANAKSAKLAKRVVPTASRRNSYTKRNGSQKGAGKNKSKRNGGQKGGKNKTKRNGGQNKTKRNDGQKGGQKKNRETKKIWLKNKLASW
mgnify:CR=1 FL=1